MSFIHNIASSIRLDFQPLDNPLQRRQRAFAAFLLIFMSGQWVLFEGNPLSWPKMITMALAPIILMLLKVNPLSKGMALGMLYWLTICTTSWLHPYRVNHMSLWFTFPFILLFGSYDAMLRKNVFTRDDFEKILLWVMMAYLVFLLLQQFCWAIGVHRIVLFNRWKPLGFKFQSLGLEPSYAARLFGPYAFAYLEMLRLKHGKNLSLSFLWRNYRWPMLGIVYFFVTLGSGSGWACLGFLGMYLAWNGQRGTALLLFLGILMAPPDLVEARDRAVNMLKATVSLETEAIWSIDQSAAFRVGVLFNFLSGFRLDLLEFWVGQGAYTHVFKSNGIIMLYGIFGYLAQILLFRVCSFRRFRSFEFLYFMIFFTTCVGNVVNQWAVMMLFATLKHIHFASASRFRPVNPLTEL